MALSILDGNQSATTLSTILSSGQHITAHTVVSLGTQAITDMRGAVSGSVVSISNFPATQTISGTVTLGVGTAQIGSVTASNLADVLDQYEVNAQEKAFAVAASISGQGYVSDSAKSHITNSVTIGSALPAGTAQIGSVTASISGTVTAGLSNAVSPSLGTPYGSGDPYPVGAKIIPVGGWTSEVDGAHWQALSLTDGGALSVYGQIAPGTNRIGVVTIGAGTVTIGAGTAQIGSVTASISNSVTIGSLPAISGTVTANTFALQGTAVTTSNFTSTTASTVLANFNATREVLTIFNEGAGNLHICAGATCTTIAYQVRLSAGDYYEVPNHQTTITHSAVFATAGTARVTQVS